MNDTRTTFLYETLILHCFRIVFFYPLREFLIPINYNLRTIAEPPQVLSAVTCQK